MKLGKANGDFHGDTQIEFEEKDRQAPEKEEPRKDEEVQEKVRNRKVEEIATFPLTLLPYAPAMRNASCAVIAEGDLSEAKSERVNLASDGAWEKG